MSYLLIILAAVGTGVFGANFFPTEEMLQDRFALGQKYYAANDHENSVEVFSQIEAMPNYALLDVDRIEVTIGELTLPIRVAATYQLGNSNRNVGRSLLERSRNAASEGDSALAAQRLSEASAAFNAGKDFYRRLVGNGERVPVHLRQMASYQIVRASYQMEDYPSVVVEAEEMLALFPQSDYREAALYDAGWAHYYMDEYDAAIATFARLLAVSNDALKYDRALFQTGESYFALGNYDRAREAYGRLSEKYDFSSLSEKELQEMKTQRLRGLVRETTRELVAKAQIRIGDSYAEQKLLNEAIAAYSQVPARYPQEDLLVQKSFDNMAAMVLEQRGPDAGVAVLRQAIEQVADPVFRGRVQLKIARILYRENRYGEAIAEYGVYRKAYGDIAASIGVTLDQIDFLVGEAHREQAQRAAAQENYTQAQIAYRRILDNYPQSQRLPEAYYGLGHALYGLGERDKARQLFAQTVELFPRAPVAAYALSWQARLVFAEGNAQEALALYEQLLSAYPDSPLRDEAWKDKALVYKELGLLDEAISAFGQVGNSSPMWGKIQAEAGDMLLAAGRLDEIDRRFDIDGAIDKARADGDVETLAELHYIKGRLARERGDQTTEVEQLTHVVEYSKNDQLRSFALFFRGLAYYQMGSRSDAGGDTLQGSAYFEYSVEDLQRVLDDDPAPQLRGVAYRTRGVALTRLSRSAEAVRIYEILIESAPTAQERSEFELMLMELYYDQGELGQTENVARNIIATAGAENIARRAYFVLVSLLLEQERYEETHAAARKALARFPQGEDRATLMSVGARSLFFLERYEDAIKAFTDFIAVYPEHPERASAYYQMGYCHEILGQFERAAAAFIALADAYPHDALTPDALYRSGENLYNAAKFEQALERYLQVGEGYRASPFAAKALYSASWTYMDLGKERESIATMQRLVEEYPTSEYARFAQFSVADYYYSQKDYERAQNIYREVVAQYPGTSEAEKAQGLIVDLDEDLASVAYDEVFVDFDRGNYAAAVRGFERIFQQYPGSYSALAALANKGVALEHLGNGDEARGIYQKVLDIAATNPESEGIVEFVKLRLENL